MSQEPEWLIGALLRDGDVWFFVSMVALAVVIGVDIRKSYRNLDEG